MMRLTGMMELLASRTLTVWLTGIFIIYYLSMAVWSHEAFGHVMALLSGNTLARALYILFLANLACRTAFNLKMLWPQKSVFLFRLPLYIGGLVLLFAFFMSLNVRKNTWILAGEGDPVTVPWDRSLLRVAGIRPALDRSEIRTDRSLIFSSEPLITLLDESGASHSVGAYPPRRVGSNYMHILNFGIGPGVQLRESDRLIVDTYVALRLIPFGSIDKFELPPAPYTFYLSVQPNKVINKGGETAKQYDAEKPMYAVEVVKGDKVIAKAATDDRITFDETMSLQFHTPSDWVMLDVTYDPFLPFFAVGLVVTTVGIVLYPVSFLSFKKRKSIFNRS